MKTAVRTSSTRLVPNGPAASSVLTPSRRNSPTAGTTTPSLITQNSFKEGRTFSHLRATCPVLITWQPRVGIDQQRPEPGAASAVYAGISHFGPYASPRLDHFARLVISVSAER